MSKLITVAKVIISLIIAFVIVSAISTPVKDSLENEFKTTEQYKEYKKAIEEHVSSQLNNLSRGGNYNWSAKRANEIFKKWASENHNAQYQVFYEIPPILYVLFLTFILYVLIGFICKKFKRNIRSQGI